MGDHSDILQAIEKQHVNGSNFEYKLNNRDTKYPNRGIQKSCDSKTTKFERNKLIRNVRAY